MAKTNDPIISVIMPVYNSEQFLHMAVDSILNQTFQEFELILVDDGSTDNSPGVCDEYAQKDSRVRVIHQSNGGICAARNRGMDEARGEYIGFADNDDKYLSTLLEDTYASARKYGADVVKYGYSVEESFADGFVDKRKQVSQQLLLISLDNVASQYDKIKQSGAFNMVWNGIYKKSFLLDKHLSFNNQCKYGYEDWIFNYLLFSCVQQVVILPTVYYVHYQREAFSTSKKYDDNQLNACILAIEAEQKMFEAISIQTVFPYKREEAMASGIIEILQKLYNPRCRYSVAQKAQKLLELRDEETFSNGLLEQCVRNVKKVSKTKYVVAKLFNGRKMKTLIHVSNAYFKRLYNSKRRVNK